MKHPPEKWQWFGYAGHFICSWDCHFHLCTKVGRVLVSTVGHYQPPHKKKMPQNEMDEIGLERTFETFVFKAGPPCDCGCGMPQIDGHEIDTNGYNVAADARKGHMAMCRKWAKRDYKKQP